MGWPFSKGQPIFFKLHSVGTIPSILYHFDWKLPPDQRHFPVGSKVLFLLRALWLRIRSKDNAAAVKLELQLSSKLKFVS
jgi:hypothetical protein